MTALRRGLAAALLATGVVVLTLQLRRTRLDHEPTAELLALGCLLIAAAAAVTP